MKKTLGALIFSGCLISVNVFAGNMSSASKWTSPRFFAGAAGGYTNISGAHEQQGQTPQGRFTLGVKGKVDKLWLLGGELGIQSGNSMLLEVDEAVLSSTLFIPPQADLKPLIDALFSVQFQFTPTSPVSLQVKGGIAFREMQLNNITATSGTQLFTVAGEFQGGVGVKLVENVQLNAYYQGIYSNSNAGVYRDSENNTPMSYIPTQQGGFLGIEYFFDVV